MRTGDVIVVDPRWKDPYCHCIQPEIFDYFAQIYMPQGITVVTQPEGYRRVWYVKWDSQEDRAFQERVTKGRIAGPFVGPPEALFRLYEAPPDLAGVLFENGMRFHGVEVLDQATGLALARADDTVKVRLWWSVDRPLTADYSVALHVYDGDKLVLQSDSSPQVVTPEGAGGNTSSWQVGQYYIEEREITIPKHTLSTGAYPLNLIVYDWRDGKRFSAPGETADHMLPISSVYVKAW
jgi:hypothetical protein